VYAARRTSQSLLPLAPQLLAVRIVRLALVSAGPLCSRPDACLAEPQLSRFETKYYVLHTDLEPDGVREASIRVDRMGEEYHARTTPFAGTIESKLPVYLFRRADDYRAAGGPPGSAGVYTGQSLMAVAGDVAGPRTWEVLQHEGFHQFIHAVIGGDIPIWVNEGLAEYFSHAVFTGDGFETGLIPQPRLERVRRRIQEKEFKSIQEMMELQHGEWNHSLRAENYDQAWSMVHFLAHGDDGRYDAAFNGFLQAVSLQRITWQGAWLQHFGYADEFESRWREYWEGLPDNPTETRYAQATVATLTGFLARAASQRQTFKTVDEFFAAAQAGGLKSHASDWLPPALLQQAMAEHSALGTWSVERPNGAGLICVRSDGSRHVGRFQLRGSRVAGVEVRTTPGRK